MPSEIYTQEKYSQEPDKDTKKYLGMLPKKTDARWERTMQTEEFKIARTLFTSAGFLVGGPIGAAFADWYITGGWAWLWGGLYDLLPDSWKARQLFNWDEELFAPAVHDTYRKLTVLHYELRYMPLFTGDKLGVAQLAPRQVYLDPIPKGLSKQERKDWFRKRRLSFEGPTYLANSQASRALYKRLSAYENQMQLSHIDPDYDWDSIVPAVVDIVHAAKHWPYGTINISEVKQSPVQLFERMNELDSTIQNTWIAHFKSPSAYPNGLIKALNTKRESFKKLHSQFLRAIILRGSKTHPQIKPCPKGIWDINFHPGSNYYNPAPTYLYGVPMCFISKGTKDYHEGEKPEDQWLLSLAAKSAAWMYGTYRIAPATHNSIIIMKACLRAQAMILLGITSPGEIAAGVEKIRRPRTVQMPHRKNKLDDAMSEKRFANSKADQIIQANMGSISPLLGRSAPVSTKSSSAKDSGGIVILGALGLGALIMAKR